MRKKVLSILMSAIMVFSLMIPAFAATPYSDVPDYHWAVNAVNMLTSLGIIQGYPDGTYQGTNYATRYELALMVARLLDYMEQQVSEKLGEVEDRIGNNIASNPPVISVDSVDESALEKAILDKVAAMNEEKWNEFDSKLTALFNDVYAKLNSVESSAAKQSELAALTLEFDKMKAAISELDNQPAGTEYIVNDASLKNSDTLAQLNAKVNAINEKIAALENAPANEIVKEIEKIETVTVTDPELVAQIAALNERLTDLENAPVVIDETTLKNSDALAQLNAKVSGIVAAIDALESEFGSDLKALGLRIDNLENELNNSKTAVGELSSVIRGLEGKVNANEKNIAELDKRVTANESDINAIKKAMGQNHNDILDLMANAKNDTVKPLATRVEDHAKRIRDLEYDQTNLEVRVDQIQKNMAANMEYANKNLKELDTQVVGLDTQIAGLTERLDGSIVDKMNISGSFTTEAKHVGATLKDDTASYTNLYSNLFTGSGKISKTSTIKSTLDLNTKITPEDGVSIDLRLKLTSDLYKFGKDLNGMALDGTMALTVKTASYLTKIYSGTLTAPSMFTDFTANAKKFNDAKNTGLSMTMKLGRATVDGIFAKLAENTATATDFKYLYAIGGSYSPIMDKVTVGLRGIVVTDAEEAGDTSTSAQNATISANYNVKLNDYISSNGEFALFKNDDPGFKTAAKISATANLFNALDLSANFSRVEDGFAPYYGKVTKGQNLNVTLSKSNIANVLSLSGSFDMTGGIAWPENDKVRTFGVDAEFNNKFGADTEVTVAAGADFVKDFSKSKAYNVYSVSAGVSNAVVGIDASEKYSTENSSHVIAANAELDLVKDVLSVNGGFGTKIVASDSIYTKYNVGGDLKLTLIDDVVSAAVSGNYYNKNYKGDYIDTVSSSDELKTVYKGYKVGANLAWTLTKGTTLTGNVEMENRDYQLQTNDNNSRRSGMVRMAGLSLDQQLLKSTKLNIGFNIADYQYDSELNMNNYWTRTFTFNLKTTF